MRVSAATIALALLAVAFLVAGSLTWRMTAGNCHRTANGRGVVCPAANMHGIGLIDAGSLRHRTHRVWAELLWGAGGVAALAAVVVEIRRRRPTG